MGEQKNFPPNIFENSIPGFVQFMLDEIKFRIKKSKHAFEKEVRAILYISKEPDSQKNINITFDEERKHAYILLNCKSSCRYLVPSPNIRNIPDDIHLKVNSAGYIVKVFDPNNKIFENINNGYPAI